MNRLKINAWWLLTGGAIAFGTALLSFALEDYKYGFFCLTLALFSCGYALEMFNKAANEDQEDPNADTRAP